MESGPTTRCPKTEEDSGSLKARWMDRGRTEREYRRVGHEIKVFFNERVERE